MRGALGWTSQRVAGALWLLKETVASAVSADSASSAATQKCAEDSALYGASAFTCLARARFA